MAAKITKAAKIGGSELIDEPVRSKIEAVLFLRVLRLFAANLPPSSSLTHSTIHNKTTMKDPIFQLCDTIRETAFALHRFLKHGHLEKVYENSLANRLRKLGFNVQQQHPIAVKDEDGAVLGSYFADLLVNDVLIIELKAIKELVPEHVAQILGYLRGSGVEHGLLVNFGAPVMQIKKYVLSEI